MTSSRAPAWNRRDALLAFGLLLGANVGIVLRQNDSLVALLGTATLSAAVALFIWWFAMSSVGLRIPARAAAWLLAGMWLALAAVNLLVPDEVDVRADRDDALDLAAWELIAGRDPWAVSTQIHETHHPSPGFGGIALAAPFAVVLRDSSWQNILWLALALVLVVRMAGMGSGVAAAALLVASPTFWNEWIFQSDLLVLGVKLAIGMLWGLYAMRSSGWLGFTASAVFFAFALADRFLFLAVAVVVAASAFRGVPIRRTLPWLVISGGATVALMAVPWLLAPGYRDQVLLNIAKSSEAGGVIPHAGAILGVVLVVLAAVLGWLARSDAGLVGAAGVTVAVVVVWQIVLYSLSAGSLAVTGSLAVAYTGVMLVFGIGFLVLPRDNSITGVSYRQVLTRTAPPRTDSPPA